jgi:predicted GIY-YIG superfamily endonuclease
MIKYNGIVYKDLPDNHYYVYAIYSVLSEDNSIYIGFTGDPIGRWKQHANNRKYNSKNSNPELYSWMDNIIENKKEDVIFSIIERDLTKEEACKKEIEYIEKYKQLGSNILNKTDGGIGQRGITHTIEARQKISNARKKMTIHPKSKTVYVKDLQTGELLEFVSALQCSKELTVSYSTVTNRCNQNNLNVYKEKYTFSYNKQ